MATNFLSGISVGAHQGLANLVTSKRAARAEKRDQRRYEGELALRLGQMKSEIDYRNKMFAHRVAREKDEDAKWLKKFESDENYRTAVLTETARTNKAAEEDRDLDRVQDQEQHAALLTQNLTIHNERMDMEAARIQQSADAAAADRVFKQGQEINRQNEATLDRIDRQNQQRITENYYKDMIRVQEQRLNQEQDPLERAKIIAEINRIKAQTNYYKAQTANVGTSDSGGVTFPQSRSATGDFVKTFGDSFLERFIGGKQGKAWTVPFVQRQVGEGEFAGRFNLDWPGRMDIPLPWENPGDPSADTQQKRLRSIGSEAFQGLLKEMDGDTNATLNRMPTFFAELLNDPARRRQFMDYLMFTPLNNPNTGQPYTEIEMLRLAKEELMKGARAAPGEMMQRTQKAGAAGTDKDHILDLDDAAAPKAVPDNKESFWDIF